MVELYRYFGENWEFKDKSTMVGAPNFTNIESYLQIKDSLISSRLGLDKTKFNDLSEENKIYRQTKLPWSLAMKHKDSLDAYKIRKDWSGLKIYIEKIMKEK